MLKIFGDTIGTCVILSSKYQNIFIHILFAFEYWSHYPFCIYVRGNWRRKVITLFFYLFDIALQSNIWHLLIHKTVNFIILNCQYASHTNYGEYPLKLALYFRCPTRYTIKKGGKRIENKKIFLWEIAPRKL